MLLYLKKCLTCMAIDRGFVYMAESAADLPDPATSDKAVDPPADATEGAAKEGDKGDKVAEAKGDRDEKKAEIKDDAADAVADVKASVEPVKKVLNRLKGIIHESPEDIRYAIYTYRSGQYDRPRDRTGKAKKIMGKLIQAINTKTLDRDLVFQGGVDASKFSLGKVQGLPDSWHQAKIQGFKDLLTVNIRPAESARLRDDNKAIIQGYIDCEDKAARDIYLKNNEAIFCNQFGLLNLATAYQRAQNLGKSFPDAKPTAFQLDFNSKQGERFRTSAIDIGIKVEGKKLDPVEPPAPAPEPPPTPKPPEPKENTDDQKKVIEDSYDGFVSVLDKISKKHDIFILPPRLGDLKTLDSAATQALYTDLIRNLTELDTMLNSLDADTKAKLKIVRPAIGNKVGAVADYHRIPTFFLDITKGQDEMKKRIQLATNAEFQTYIEAGLITKNVHLFSDGKYDLSKIWENKDKLFRALDFARNELKDNPKKLNFLNTLPIYINPDNSSSEGYDKAQNLIRIDIEERMGGGKMFHDGIVHYLIDGVDDADDALKSAPVSPKK